MQLHQAIIQQSSQPGALKYIWGSSNEPPGDTGRLMGGTGLAIRHRSVGRIAPKGTGYDRMGRWTFTHFRRNQRPPLTVIAIYQVCKQPTNKIGYTAWHQQRRLLDIEDRNTEHPRVAFHNDLVSFIQELQSNNHDIIVGGDWNDFLTQSDSSLLQLSATLQLVDPWMQHYPEDQDFATYERGQHRIDSVFVSPSLLPSILHIGYTPVGYITNSDHRAIIIEFQSSGIFGHETTQMPTYLSRSIRSNDKQAVTKFIDKAYHHLLSHNAFHRATHVQDQTTADGPTIELVETLDKLLGEAFKVGETRCARRRSTWFSLPLVKLRRETSYLRHHCNGLRFGVDRTNSTQAKLLDIQSDIQVCNNLSNMHTIYQQKLQELHQLQRTSREARQEHLDKMTENSSKSDAQAITKLNRKEVSQRTWKQLAFLSNDGDYQQLDRLDIPADWPGPDGEITATTQLSDPKEAQSWQTITNPQHIEYYIILRNKKHFSQALSTPFTISPLSEEINWEATSPFAESLLTGRQEDYVHIHQLITDPLCQKFLQGLNKLTDKDLVTATLSLEELAGKMKVWREDTTTSPSDRHLGCYKALFSRGIYTIADEERYTAFITQQTEIRKLVLTIINFCIRTGYILRRWTQIVNTMIFKEKGVYKIHKLRVIHIYEADYNLLLAVKWRTLLQMADRQGIINPHQYGGRPGHEATSLALLEELKIDISLATRRSLLTFDNDAASCYDRIVPSLASVINRRYGLPKLLSQLHGKALQESHFRIRTPAGISDSWYAHCDTNPIYGTGQGSGNSPAVWLFISATLFDTYESTAQGAYFCNTDGDEPLILKITGFVDDTNTSLNKWLPQTDAKMEDLQQALTADAQTWNDLLFISGGKLELAKCSYHALRFTFEANGTPHVIIDAPPAIKLRDSVTGQHIEIRGLAANEPHKTLGHWKSPTGKPTRQLQTLKSKSVQVSKLIASSTIPRTGAKLAYHAKYVAALRFVLPQCYFSIKSLFQTQRSSMPAIISKCGFSSKTPHALLYAPIEFGGGGFVHWAVLQGEGQITHFLKHWRTDTPISKALRLALNWTQWTAGISTSILEDTTTPLPHVESRWIMSLRNSLHYFGATLQLDRPYIPSPEREHDRYIMDIAITSGIFTPFQLRILNFCRMYLHLTTVSEMFDAAGEGIMHHVRHGVRPFWFNPTTYTVIQKRPSTHQWKTVWAKLCEIVEPIGALLGRWITHQHTPRLRRATYVHNRKLYHHYAGEYWRCIHRVDPYQFDLCKPTKWVPTEDSIPVNVTARIKEKVYCHVNVLDIHRENYTTAKIHHPVAETFTAFVNQLPKNQQYLAQHIDWHVGPYECRQHLCRSSPERPILIVSDGSSFEGQRMSFGVAIATSDGHILLTNNGVAHGCPSSHRAECTGCLSGGFILDQLAKYTNAPTPLPIYVKVISDNKGMITSLQKRQEYSHPYPNSTLVADWDLLEEIFYIYENVIQHSQVTYEWVKGHQDGNALNSTTDLPIEAQLNIMADELAGRYYYDYSTTTHHYQTPFTTQCGCVLNINQQSIHGNFIRELRRSAAERPFREYMTKRHNWSRDTYEDVDWQVFRMAARTYSSTEIHLLKLLHDYLPTRCHVARFQPWRPSNCYHCQHQDTIDHLQQCTANPITKPWQAKFVKTIRDYCEKHSTPTKFQYKLIQSINQWFMNQSPTQISHSDNVDPQRKIGWRLFTRGFLSLTWRRLLHQSLWELKWQDANLSYDVEDTEYDNVTEASEQIEFTLDEDTIVSTTDDNASTESTSSTHQQAARISNPHRQQFDTTTFLAGLIKLMWKLLSELWITHLEAVHTPVTGSSSPVVLHDLRSHIRFLHTFKDKVIEAHKQRYFILDLQQYLDTATETHMRQYIRQYRPAIISSWKAARRTTQPRTTDTTSFNNTDDNNSVTSWSDDTSTSDTSNEPSRPGHPALEEAPHRKRTRRRFLHSSITIHHRQT